MSRLSQTLSFISCTLSSLSSSLCAISSVLSSLDLVSLQTIYSILNSLSNGTFSSLITIQLSNVSFISVSQSLSSVSSILSSLNKSIYLGSLVVSRQINLQTSFGQNQSVTLYRINNNINSDYVLIRYSSLSTVSGSTSIYIYQRRCRDFDGSTIIQMQLDVTSLSIVLVVSFSIKEDILTDVDLNSSTTRYRQSQLTSCSIPGRSRNNTRNYYIRGAIITHSYNDLSVLITSFNLLNQSSTTSYISNSLGDSSINSLCRSNMHIIAGIINSCSHRIADYMPLRTIPCFNSIAVTQDINLTNVRSTRLGSSYDNVITKINVTFVQLARVSTEIQYISILGCYCVITSLKTG